MQLATGYFLLFATRWQQRKDSPLVIDRVCLYFFFLQLTNCLPIRRQDLPSFIFHGQKTAVGRHPPPSPFPWLSLSLWRWRSLFVFLLVLVSFLTSYCSLTLVSMMWLCIPLQTTRAVQIAARDFQKLIVAPKRIKLYRHPTVPSVPTCLTHRFQPREGSLA